MEIKIVHPTLGEVTVGVVEGMTIELLKEGGVEYIYGSQTGKMAIGTKHATFTVRRWYYTDTDKDLLFDIFNDESYFALYGTITGQNNSRIFLSNCKGLRWRPVTGTANDTIAEELIGEAESWDTAKPTD